MSVTRTFSGKPPHNPLKKHKVHRVALPCGVSTFVNRTFEYMNTDIDARIPEITIMLLPVNQDGAPSDNPAFQFKVGISAVFDGKETYDRFYKLLLAKDAGTREDFFKFLEVHQDETNPKHQKLTTQLDTAERVNKFKNFLDAFDKIEVFNSDTRSAMYELFNFKVSNPRLFVTATIKNFKETGIVRKPVEKAEKEKAESKKVVMTAKKK